MPGGDAEHVSSSLNNSHLDYHHHHSFYNLSHATFDDSLIVPASPANPSCSSSSSCSLSEPVSPQLSSMSGNVPSNNHIIDNTNFDNSNNISEESGRMSPDPHRYYHLLHQTSLADGQRQQQEDSVLRFPSLPSESLDRPHDHSRRPPYRSASAASSCSSSSSYKAFARDFGGERPAALSTRPRQSTFRDLVNRFNNNSDQVLPIPSASGSRVPSGTESRSSSFDGQAWSRASLRLPDTCEPSHTRTRPPVRWNLHPDSYLPSYSNDRPFFTTTTSDTSIFGQGNPSLVDWNPPGGPRYQVLPEHGDLSQLRRRGSDGNLANSNPTFLEHCLLDQTVSAGLPAHQTFTAVATTADTNYHRRARSDDFPKNLPSQSRHMAVPPPLNPSVVHESPTWKSRIPVSSRRLSQDSVSDNNDSSSSPLTANATFRSRSSGVVLPPKGTSRLPVPTSPTSTASVLSKTAPPASPTKCQVSRDVANSNRGRHQLRQDGTLLKAYIAAPPPKKSPLLRSSRPRQPVSSATAMSTARRSKVLEKASSLQKQAESRATRPRDRRAPELAKVDFAMRRHKIQQAFNKTIQENARKEEQEAQRRHRTNAVAASKPKPNPSGTQKNLPEGAQSADNDTMVDEKHTQQTDNNHNNNTTTTTTDATVVVGESSTEFHHDVEKSERQPTPADRDFHGDSKEAIGNSEVAIPQPEVASAVVPPQADSQNGNADAEPVSATMDSPALGRPDAAATDRERSPSNRPALQPSAIPAHSSSPPSDTSGSNDTYITSFDPEPQTEPPEEQQDFRSHKSLLSQIMLMRDKSSPSSSSSCHEQDYSFSDNDDKDSIPILLGESPYVGDTMDDRYARQDRGLYTQQQDRPDADVPNRWSLSSWPSSVPDPLASDVPHGIGHGFSRHGTYPEEEEAMEETMEEEETSLCSVASTSAAPSVAEDQSDPMTSFPRSDDQLDERGSREPLQQNFHTFSLSDAPSLARQGGWDTKRVTQLYLEELTRGKGRNLPMPAVRASPETRSLDLTDRPVDAKTNSLTDEPVVVSKFEGIPTSDKVGHSASLVFRDDWEHASPSIADWMQVAADDGAAPPEDNNINYDTVPKYEGEGSTPTPLTVSPAELVGSEVSGAGPGQNEDFQALQELDSQQASAPPIPVHSPPPPPPPPSAPAPLFRIARRPVPSTKNENGLAQPPPLYAADTTRSNESQPLPDGASSGPEVIPSTGSSEDSSLRRLRPATSSLGRSSATSLFPPSSEQASIEAKRSSPSPEQRRLKKRRHVIKELVDTEYTFGRDMKVVDDIYKGTSSSCLDLSTDDVKVLFANSDQIVQFSIGFQDALKAAAKSVYVMPKSQRWGSKRSTRGDLSNASKDERFTDVGMSDFEQDQLTFIGQAFLAHLSQMEKVYADYLKNHDAANKKLQVLQRNPKVAIWLKECREWASDLTSAWDLDSLLVKPVQRILKYPLLLKQLLDSTPDDHPDHEMIVRALDGVTDVSVRINEMKKRAELVEQVIGRKRKESDVRAGLSKAFGRRTEKLRQQVGLSDMFEDRQYDKLSQRFGDNFFQLQVVMRDVENYTREIQEAMGWFNEFVSAIEAYTDMAQSHYPDMEGRWRQFKAIVRDIVSTALPDHLSAVRKSSIDPMITLLKLHEGPQRVMHKRDKRLMDYARFRAVKDRGDKPEKKTIEQGEQFLALNDALKDELPKLYSLTGKLTQACLKSFVQLQVTWFDLLRTKLGHLTDSFPDDIQNVINGWSSGFAYTEGQIMTLGICNGTVLAEVVSSSSSVAAAAAAAAAANSFSHSSDAGFSAPRRPSTVNSNGAGTAMRIGSSSSADDSSKFSQDFGSMIRSPNLDGYSRRSNSRNRADSSISGRGRRGFGSSETATAEMQRTQALQQVLNEPPSRNRRAEPFPRLPSLNLDAPFMDEVLGIASSNNQPASPGGGRYSGFFSSAMPLPDSPHAPDHDYNHGHTPSTAAVAAESEQRKEPNVLFLAASICEFNIDRARREAGYPYLTYVAGEIFDVIAEKGELWLAKNQDDPTCQVGWIWNKHFVNLAA